jgi:hypothetical protein
MHVDRSIRAMTPQEKQAKREWGTGACQVRGCTTRAAYLVLETSSGESAGSGEAGCNDWWQYCCSKHARYFAEQHGLAVPASAARAARRVVGPDSSPTPVHPDPLLEA